MKLKFVPFEVVTYETKLTEEEVMNRLSDCIQPGDFHGLKRIYIAERSKPYEGILEERKFKIVRITDAPRADPPIIVGYVDSDLNKTTIKVTIRIYIFHMIILGILFLSGIFFQTMVLSLFFFLYIITMINFHGERELAKTRLQELFEAEEV